MSAKRLVQGIRGYAAHLHWRADRWFFLAGGLFCVLSLLNYGAQYKALQQLFAQNHWALHSEGVRACLNAIQAESSSGESSVEGYIITGDSRYLASYQSASARTRNRLRHVRRLTADNTTQQKRLQDLGILLVQKDALMEQLIVERTLDGNAAADRLTIEGRGARLTQKIDLTIQEMGKEEQQLLMSRSANAEESASRTIRTASLATALALIILVLAGLALYRNIGYRNQVEMRLRRERDLVKQRTAQLEAANKELEAFSYSVSHDLRAPLRQVGDFARLLVEDCGTQLGASGTHYLRRVTEGCERMSALVEALLQLARTGRQEIVRRPTNLRNLAESVIAELSAEAQDRKVEWRVGDLPELDCDPVLMGQLFANLFSNALKFTRGRVPGVIEVGHARRGGEWLIFVRDNGVGFDMKYAGKLFGVFQRLHRAEDFDGLGIGLATVQRIVHKHGGQLWADAEPDRGATFYFTLDPHGEGAALDQTGNCESRRGIT